MEGRDLTRVAFVKKEIKLQCDMQLMSVHTHSHTPDPYRILVVVFD